MAVESLKCKECGEAYPLEASFVCEQCFGPLEVSYDFSDLDAEETRRKIQTGSHGIWRYSDFLPFAGRPGDPLEPGLTPLIRADRLGAELGFAAPLWVKDDSANPTHSFKDRVVSVALARAREFGFDTVACASTGNLANALAAHAAEAGLTCYVFVPADLEAAKMLPTLVYGATVIAVDGTYDEVNRLCLEIGDRYPWAFVNANLRPYYAEGAKTYGYEIVEQLGWTMPGHVVVPCAGGSLMTKIEAAMDDVVRLGLVDGATRTKIHAAQPAGCGPIVTMIKDDTDVLVPVRPDTIAKSLAMGNPGDGYYARQTAKRTGGYGEHATDDEIVAGMLLLARTEGIFTEAAGGVAVAATQKLVATGRIPRDESIVICLTGNGLKTPDALAGRLAAHVTIRPSLGAFDRALADLKPRTTQEASPWR